MTTPAKISFWESNAVRALAADVLSDVALALGTTALAVQGGVEVDLGVVWTLVGISAAKKAVLVLARMLGVGTSGDSPKVDVPTPV